MFATCAQCFAQKGKKVTKEQAFRIWYDAREGTKSEGFAWDVWQAAWHAAITPESCMCESIQLCNTFDRCMKK